MAKISDIKVLGPGDKLIIKFKRQPSNAQREVAKKTVDNFLKEDDVLYVSNLDVYIMKKGSKVLLKDELNKELGE